MCKHCLIPRYHIIDVCLILETCCSLSSCLSGKYSAVFVLASSDESTDTQSLSGRYKMEPLMAASKLLEVSLVIIENTFVQKNENDLNCGKDRPEEKNI